MAEEPRLNDDLESLAAALSGLALRGSRVNRDRLMFEAGQAAALAKLSASRTALRYWMGATAISTVAAACLAVLVALRGGDDIQVAQIKSQHTAPRQNDSAPFLIQSDAQLGGPVEQVAPGSKDSEMSYVKNREIALADGVDQIPISADSGGEYAAPVTYRELLKSYSPPRDSGG